MNIQNYSVPISIETLIITELKRYFLVSELLELDDKSYSDLFLEAKKNLDL